MKLNHLMQFPVEEVLPGLRGALSASSCCVLIAPPGAGKTTIVPTALLHEPWLNGKKIIMLEPRRIAARRAAEYMATRRKERCGETIGYRIRLESVTGPTTRIEVVTEGILTRMLQTDAELPETGLIIFDEYHERSIHADTGLAFALDVQKTIRPDLKILIMSATPDRQKLLTLLGDIPVIGSEGKIFPVVTHYLKHPSEKRFEQKTADAVLNALHKEVGDILVFLPGKAEIKRTHRLLDESLRSVEYLIYELHGGATNAEQDAALQTAPAGKRKIILATSIAETSLTINGVRVVIDSGVSRVSSYNPRRGMPGLATVPVSQATADQRRGRAGREQDGVCYRLWTRQDEMLHPRHTQPEILTSDLTPLALELAQWGAPRAEGLSFPDPPPSEMLNPAINTLYRLGATDENGRLTEYGRGMSRLPVHPRLAAMLLSAKQHGTAYEACLLAAILEESGRRQNMTAFDIQEEFDFLCDSGGREANHIHEHAKKLQKICGLRNIGMKKVGVGYLLAIAYPERIAKRQRGNHYQLSMGMAVSIPEGSKLNTEEFLVITDIDAAPNVGKAFRAAAMKREDIFSLFGNRIVREETVEWIDDAVRGKQRMTFGEITIQEKDFNPPDELAQECILRIVKTKGWSFFAISDDDNRFLERSEWLRLHVLANLSAEQDMWPVLTAEALTGTAENWLAPFLSGIRKKKEVDNLCIHKILKTLFTYEQLKKLDEFAPEFFAAPGGSNIRIQYNESSKPVIAVRLQEMFGQTETPTVGGGSIPLLIHLLSPAHRPLAITQDLHSFWQNTYPDILKQMRGKYPKHIWPDDPLNAIPTNKTKRAFNR
ncbi:MAG: ATP-dependent helicase HrpB [Ignavibacteriales bacterium]|nr:ATP-dependent helicase HrpB [Ignavibacteriales bacterium]